MAKQNLQQIISNAIKGLQKKALFSSFEMPEILIEHSQEKKFGDYSTTVALKIGKMLGKNPIEVANLVVNEINKANNDVLEKIEVVSPGFINFWLKSVIFTKNTKEVLSRKKDFGKGVGLKNKKVVIDYTDPNPFKEFHIGHLMSNAIGESLSRIFEFQGAKVKRVCYQGDVGMHVAKAIWGYQHVEPIKFQNNFSSELGKWSYAYTFGSRLYDEKETAKKEIIELNKKIYERRDEYKDINKLYDDGKKVSLRHFDEIYKKLGTKFDELIFESETGKVGEDIVKKGLKNGIFEKGDKGAIIFKGEKCGLHTRVFINSEELPTYEAKDLGLAKIKYDKFKYDLSVVVTGNEVNEYFKVMLCAMKEVSPEFEEKTKHIGHGMLRLPEGKMSSRTGKVITGEFLISKLEELVKSKIENRDLLDKEKQEIITRVAIGAIKYSILKQSIGKDIVYDFDKSISFEGDSGPYLQYSYARAKSVLRKAKTEKIKASLKSIPDCISQLEKMMYYFPEVIDRAGTSYEPHHILSYLTELAGTFNAFYAENKIVDKEDKFSSYKVAITEAFAYTMENGLWLLGINVLEKM